MERSQRTPSIIPIVAPASRTISPIIARMRRVKCKVERNGKVWSIESVAAVAAPAITSCVTTRRDPPRCCIPSRTRPSWCCLPAGADSPWRCGATRCLSTLACLHLDHMGMSDIGKQCGSKIRHGCLRGPECRRSKAQYADCDCGEELSRHQYLPIVSVWRCDIFRRSVSTNASDGR